MKRLPRKPSLDHLKKQAKDLLSRHREGDPEAVARVQATLPRAVPDSLRLHDAQACIARDYGFASWTELKRFVALSSAQTSDPATLLRTLLSLVYAGDIAGGMNRAQPALAARLLEEAKDRLPESPYLACAIGDDATLRRETERHPAWVNEAGGPLALPPLVAVTQSSLIRLPAYRDGLLRSTKALLDAGADPNQSVPSRWAATPETASKAFPLSALYGAAGQNHDEEMTRLLLAAGADPDDNESLYHSLDNPACTRLLLEAGARITGTNALYRALDLADPEPLRLLLAYGADPNEPPPGPPTSDWGAPLLWAIRRQRSSAHIAALLAAGADPNTRTPGGESAYDLARQFGLPDVAEALRKAGATVPPRTSLADEFVAACARADEKAARAILAETPDIVGKLSERQLRIMPELAAEGQDAAVRLMVTLGWPIDARGGDWTASALNLAVFRGDAELARFLLANGAQWTERHGFDDNVLGTLSWASCNEPVEGGDWAGCAEALVSAGLPPARWNPDGSGAVLIDGHRKRFSDAVAEILLAASAT